VEAFFYAYHPFVNRAVSALRTRGALLFCLGVVVVGAGYKVALYHSGGAIPLVPAPVLHSVAFLLGIGLAVALRSGWRPRFPVWLAFLVCAGGLLTIWYAGNHPSAVPGGTTISLVQKELLAALYGLVIVAVAVRDLRGGRSWLRSRPLVALGQWSYAFYLLHATILYAVREVNGLVTPISWTNLWWYGAVLAVAVLAFTFHWANFIDPLLYLQRGDRYTYPMGLQFLRLLNPTDWPLLMAGCVIATVPCVLVFLLAQRILLSDDPLTALRRRR
jgi:peptidoglycan/LPS O-acetylase OafA/YrhL